MAKGGTLPVVTGMAAGARGAEPAPLPKDFQHRFPLGVDVAIAQVGDDVAAGEEISGGVFDVQADEGVFERCSVDPARIALAGFSDGASYALSLGACNGDLLTHLVAFSPGFYDPGEPIVGRPRVFVSHGIQDPILSVEGTQNVILPTLLTDGYDVTYEEFSGGHSVPRSIGDQAFDWFLG